MTNKFSFAATRISDYINDFAYDFAGLGLVG